MSPWDSAGRCPGHAQYLKVETVTNPNPIRLNSWACCIIVQSHLVILVPIVQIQSSWNICLVFIIFVQIHFLQLGPFGDLQFHYVTFIIHIYAYIHILYYKQSSEYTYTWHPPFLRLRHRCDPLSLNLRLNSKILDLPIDGLNPSTRWSKHPQQSISSTKAAAADWVEAPQGIQPAENQHQLNKGWSCTAILKNLL